MNKTENTFETEMEMYAGGGRDDFERLKVAPYEKNMMDLGIEPHSAPNTDGIGVYRLTPESVGVEIQIRPAYQMIYALKGECHLDIQGKRTRIPEGGILFITRGIPHTVIMDDSAAAVCVMLPVELLKKKFNKIVEFQSPVSAFISNSLWGDASSPFMLFHKPANRYVRSLLQMLISEECYPSASSELIKEFIIMTLIGYLSSYTPAEFDLSSIRIVRTDQIPRILNFINDNYRTVTLESMAKNFHYTVPYVSKLIRTSTGMTFTSILRETKFDVCRAMLLNSDLKIYQIAEIAGFQNTDHFNRSFKKRTGVTPSDYKKSRLDK